jgi:stearoyl-CoA desaturase (delta-9 desaturase)
VCVTLFLHRSQAHRGIEFHPIVSHFMRFWLWLTTGMVTKEWVAVHRKHHSNTDKPSDPHSPYNEGLLRMLIGGAWLYAKAANDKKMVQIYGTGTPDDWMERNVYSKHSKIGFTLLLIFNTLMFNGWGIVIWLIQMAWIPFWAAGVINGVGHCIGYINWKTKDQSKNIFPLGIIVGGEELHNNHHNSPGNPKLSNKWYEFDIGWMWFNIFKFLRLAK